MGIQYLTLVTCERCSKEARYDARGYDSEAEQALQSEWALCWPTSVTPVRALPTHGMETLVCRDCLTDAEMTQLTERRLAFEDEAVPFLAIPARRAERLLQLPARRVRVRAQMSALCQQTPVQPCLTVSRRLSVARAVSLNHAQPGDRLAAGSHPVAWVVVLGD